MNAQILSRVRDAAKKYKYLLLVIAAGILLLLLPSGRTSAPAQAADAEPSYDEFDLAGFCRELETALEQMAGVGKTEVVLTLKSTMETVYQSDLSVDTRDASRSEDVKTVLTGAGSGVQKPVVTARRYPQFMGALVVCDGGGSASVRLEVTRAVAVLTGLSSDRITVARRDQ